MIATTKDFRAVVVDLFQTIKMKSRERLQLLPITDPATGMLLGRLRHVPDCPPGTINADVRLMTEWRESAAEWFPSQFKVTLEGTRHWYSDLVFGREDRILFMVETLDGRPVGHLGLSSFDFQRRTCENDNVVRGVGADTIWPGAMTYATLAIARWAYDFVKVEKLLLRVFSDNTRALALYRRCGFTEVGRVPLQRVVEADVTRWVEASDLPPDQAERHFVTMYLPRATLDRLSPP